LATIDTPGWPTPNSPQREIRTSAADAALAQIDRIELAEALDAYRFRKAASPSDSSLNACDLASHGEWEVRGDARPETRFHFRTGTIVVPWPVVSVSGLPSARFRAR